MDCEFDAAEVLSRTELMEVIAPYVELKKSGVEYVGICCLHSERTPSFSVSKVKQLWMCRGCGAGGDAITFIEKMLCLSFKDALAYLAGNSVEHAEPIKRDTRKAEQLERERRQENELAACEARNLIQTCEHKHHDYILRKAQGHASALAKEYGLVTPDNVLVIPLHSVDDYSIVGAQKIAWDGESFEKKYIYGTKASGAIFYIGSRDFPETIYCEGYATGLSIKAAIGPMRIKVGVCFSAGNLLKVAQATSGPGRYIFADNDRSGTGQKFAEQSGLPWIMTPELGDANDCHQARGVIAVRSLILKLRKQS